MNDYAKYLQNYSVLLSVFALLFIVLLFIIWYCKKNGSKSNLATISFYIPMIGSVIIGILLYYTPYFWISVVLYGVLFIIINIVSFKALEQSITDKTGLGVTMFSGLISMYIVVFAIILRALVSFFTT